MMKIELTVPMGMFDEDARESAALRMLDDISRGDCQTPAEAAVARAAWQVVVHEAVAWATGGEPRPVVRVSFPAAMLSDEGREVFMAKIAAALAPHEPWIYFEAVPIRPGESTAIDPICGMTVDLTGEPITFEHDGEGYAFCNQGCKAAFAEQVAS